MSSQDSFIREFIALRDGTIVTALSDIGRQLQQQGHDYRIEDTVRLPPGTLAAPPYAGVTLEVYPSDVDWKAIERFRLINKVPSITFGVDLSRRKVVVFGTPTVRAGVRSFGLVRGR